MDLDVELLADVAVLRLDDIASLRILTRVNLLEGFRRRGVRRGEDRLLAQHPDTGVGEHRLVAIGSRCLLVASHGLSPKATLDEIRLVHVSGRTQEPRSLFDVQRPEQAPVAHDLLERSS